MAKTDFTQPESDMAVNLDIAHQHVNLLKCLPTALQYPLSTKVMVRLTALFIIILFAIYGYAIFHHFQLTNELKTLKQKNAQLQTEFGLLSQQSLAQEEIQKGLLAQKQTLLQKKQLLFLLEEKDTKFFSKIFNILAETSVPNLWLTKIDITESDQQIILAGAAIAIHDVLAFVEKLNKSNIAADKLFRLASMDKPDKKHKHYTFELLRAARAS